MADTPFDSIESAHEYVRLLACQVDEVAAGVLDDIAEAEGARAARRVDALRLVDYKLKQLSSHLNASRSILNDLRMLRRLLIGERRALLAGSDTESQTQKAAPSSAIDSRRADLDF